jgi:outer membrane protein assembly factor BamE
MRKLLFSFSLTVSLMLTACSTVLNNLPGVYTLEIQQGNIVDQDMINQLRPNMDKRQVLYIMGSPMLTDYFHKNRWDYVYSVRPSGEDQVQKKVFLVFKEVDGTDRLQGLYGDFKPSNLPVVAPPKEQVVDLPKREIDYTMWEMITGLFGFDSSDSTSTTDKTDKTKSNAANLPF